MGRSVAWVAYTDENLLGNWGAIDSLPSYAAGASQIASQILGADGQNVSLAVATGNGVKSQNGVEKKGIVAFCRYLSRVVNL